MIRVASIGECMIELRHRSATTLDLAYGGDTLNTAVYLARLTGDRDVRVDYVSALGDDAYSDGMLAMWRAERIGVDLVAPARAPARPAHHPHRCGERSFTWLALRLGGARHACGDRAAQVAAALAGYDLSISPGSRSPSSIRRSGRRWSRSRMRCARTAGGWRSTATTAPWLARPRRGARRVRPDARAGRHRPADARRRAGPVRREGRPGIRRAAAPTWRRRGLRSSWGRGVASCPRHSSPARSRANRWASWSTAPQPATASMQAIWARLLGADPLRAARLGNRLAARHRLSRRDHPGRGHDGHPPRLTGEVSPSVRRGVLPVGDAAAAHQDAEPGGDRQRGACPVRATKTPPDQLERQHVAAGDQQQRELDAEERVGGDLQGIGREQQRAGRGREREAGPRPGQREAQDGIAGSARPSPSRRRSAARIMPNSVAAPTTWLTLAAG